MIGWAGRSWVLTQLIFALVQSSDGTSLFFSSRAELELWTSSFELFRAEPTKYGNMYRTRAIRCQASIFCKFGSVFKRRHVSRGHLKKNYFGKRFSWNFRAKSWRIWANWDIDRCRVTFSKVNCDYFPSMEWYLEINFLYYTGNNSSRHVIKRACKKILRKFWLKKIERETRTQIRQKKLLILFEK